MDRPSHLTPIIVIQAHFSSFYLSNLSQSIMQGWAVTSWGKKSDCNLLWNKKNLHSFIPNGREWKSSSSVVKGSDCLWWSYHKVILSQGGLICSFHRKASWGNSALTTQTTYRYLSCKMRSTANHRVTRNSIWLWGRSFFFAMMMIQPAKVRIKVNNLLAWSGSTSSNILWCS